MTYNAVFHVDQNDDAVMNLALTNVINLLIAIPGQEHDLVVLFNGPGAKLVTRDNVTSYLERIKDLAAKGVRFQICKNAMIRFEISPEQILDEFEIIPAGIVTLIDLQNDGFSYIKP
ncbi:MAG: DsrE family protein [Proteobacteria bacterium]|nr:DsrE family protein [Pseudomonadota bacterium]MBU1231718.1 DsrE family protein [Pseudomonadota bacterium]MBU1420326.1 DsrE family protein [Pseudomonadota bacterium]MBU1456549.1 DsrE family protein [Pseudomonadota bacterium]